MDGASDENGEEWCNIKLELYNKKMCVIYCENKSSNMDGNHFSYVTDIHWKWPEPADKKSRWSYLPKDFQDDYYLTWKAVQIKEDATFEEVEAILLRLMERFKELKSEYKEKKAEDDFDPTAALFESEVGFSIGIIKKLKDPNLLEWVRTEMKNKATEFDNACKFIERYEEQYRQWQEMQRQANIFYNKIQKNINAELRANGDFK